MQRIEAARRVVFELSTGRVMYSRYYGKRLTEVCADIARERSQLTLEPEVILSRAMVVDAIETYERSVDDAVAAGATGAKLSAVKMAAWNVVLSAASAVRDMVLAHHRVTSAASLDATAMQAVIMQTVQVFDSNLQQIAPQLRRVGVDPGQFMDGLAAQLGDRVRLPRGYDGTELTPADDEARAMDATVPASMEELVA